ncbi:MAG: hypothetical protein IJS40_00115 [Synergistaceae bacterium]|nr:hypothetical protein [Synergistaceae bacterium]
MTKINAGKNVDNVDEDEFYLVRNDADDPVRRVYNFIKDTIKKIVIIEDW